MKSQTLSNLSLLSGRAMLSAMFIMAGYSKIGAYAGKEPDPFTIRRKERLGPTLLEFDGNV